MKGRALAFALAASLLAACVGDRERPLATGPATEASLSVWLVSPQTNDLVIEGRVVPVTVRAQEPRARLSGIGFAARRSPGGETAADTVIVFPATADTTITFGFEVPLEDRDNIQFDIVGIAFGTGGERRESESESVIAVRCPANATWC